MAKIKLANHYLSQAEERAFINALRTVEIANEVKKVLLTVKQSVDLEQDRVVQAYMMNDDPTTRAAALKLKGKSELVEDFLRLIDSVTE